jgi:hypothetical protein
MNGSPSGAIDLLRPCPSCCLVGDAERAADDGVGGTIVASDNGFGKDDNGSGVCVVPEYFEGD